MSDGVCVCRFDCSHWPRNHGTTRGLCRASALLLVIKHLRGKQRRDSVAASCCAALSPTAEQTCSILPPQVNASLANGVLLHTFMPISSIDCFSRSGCVFLLLLFRYNRWYICMYGVFSPARVFFLVLLSTPRFSAPTPSADNLAQLRM